MIKSTTRFVAIAALVAIPVFPLIVSYSYFFPFITGKGFYFRILVEIAFAAWVVLAFLDARYRPRLNAITVGVTLFAAIALVADLLGVNPVRSFWSNFERMEGWITIFHLWMFYIVSSSMFGSAGANAGGSSGRLWWHRWMNIFIAVGLLVGLYGCAQLIGSSSWIAAHWPNIHTWFAKNYEIHQGSVRIDSSLGNAAYMAVYMLMNAGLSAYLFLVARQRGTSGSIFFQVMYGILFVFFSFLLFETATRGTILGLIGGIMLTLFLYSVFAKKESKRSRYISGGIIGAIVLIAIVFWLNRSQPFIKNSEVLNRLATISIKDTQTQARGYIWPMAIKGFTERPILGWGQENFNYVFNYHYNPHMWTQEQWFDRAHNVFLDWLIASGLFGFLSYISLYVLLLILVWKSDLLIAQKSVLTGLVAGYAVHNIFVFDNLASYVAFFALLAFAGSGLSMFDEKGKSRKLHAIGKPIGGDRIIGSEIAEYIVLPVSIVILIFGLYFFNIRAVQANTSLINAMLSCSSKSPDATLFERVFERGVYMANQETREQLIACSQSVINNQQLPAPTKRAYYDEASKAITDQIKDAPKDARMYVLGGSFMNAIGQISEAQGLLEKAHVLTPGKQVVNLELANDYLKNGYIAKCAELLKEAYDEDPTYPAARDAYAMGLILNKQEDLAHKMFGNDPAQFENEQVADIYASIGEYDKSVALYKKLIAASPDDVNLQGGLVRVYYAAKRIPEAVALLQKIEVKHPELKSQVDATIKQISH